jgi:formyltetrahydrofolate hydrolase
MRFDGAWVIGTTADIPMLVAKHDIGLMMFAVSSKKTDDYQRILELCVNMNVRLVMVADMLRALQIWLTTTGKPEIELTNE